MLLMSWIIVHVHVLHLLNWFDRQSLNETTIRRVLVNHELAEYASAQLSHSFGIQRAHFFLFFLAIPTFFNILSIIFNFKYKEIVSRSGALKI